MPLRVALARIGFRWRLAAALACLLLAGVTALESSAAPAPGKAAAPVVIAERSLPAGHRLARADLAVSHGVRGVSGTLTSPQSLLGRTLAGPVARGEPVTMLRLLDRDLTTGLSGDLAAVPVDVATDVRGLVRPGARVDLLGVAAGDTLSGKPLSPKAQRVAARVLVLAVLPPDSGSAGGCRLVLAIDRDDALRVAGMRSARLFQVAALPP